MAAEPLVVAKAATVASVVVSSTTTLAAQVTDSAATISGAAVLAGLTASAVTLIRFLIKRSTTDEGRSTEMWDDLRSERDMARDRASRSYKRIEDLKLELAGERALRVQCDSLAQQLRSEFRIRLGEEPAAWPRDDDGHERRTDDR